MGKTIIIATDLIAAVAKWAIDSREQRPHLHMVLFAKDEIVACDGHRLVRVPCETHGLRFGVDRSHIESAVMAQKRQENVMRDKDGKVALHFDLDARVAITVAIGVALSVPLRDPKDYPPIDKVMPTKSDSPDPDGYILNPRYLAAIAEVVAAESSDMRGVEVVAWSAADENGRRSGTMLLQSAGGIRFVVMPMRSA